jgi:hypothetical protein
VQILSKYMFNVSEQILSELHWRLTFLLRLNQLWIAALTMNKMKSPKLEA